MARKRYPKVLLVGRTNVGKSTLFNRLISDKRSIVFDREGVTRDYLQELITWKDKTFELIDTGGISAKKVSDPLWQKAQEKVLTLFEQAAVLLFVVDGKNGLVEEDRAIMRLLHKTQKPTVLLINKADNQTAIEDNMPEFYALGCKTIIPISGIHGIGIATLLETIVGLIGSQEGQEIEEPTHRITIIGKPNVGKSSLMNLLTQQERTIVSDVAGTTREAVSHNVFYCSDLLQLTDTAGVRKAGRINDDLESLMVKSSLAAIRSADTVIIMIDAAQGKISDQELKLLFYVYEQKKYMLIVFNKTDLQSEYAKQQLDQSMQEYDFILSKMPILNISCITQKNVGRIFGELQKVWQRSQQEFDPMVLKEIVQEELKRKVLYHTGVELKVTSIRSVQAAIPTFTLKINKPELFGIAEQNCIENILRKHFDLKGCPVQFNLKRD